MPKKKSKKAKTGSGVKEPRRTFSFRRKKDESDKPGAITAEDVENALAVTKDDGGVVVSDSETPTETPTLSRKPSFLRRKITELVTGRRTPSHTNSELDGKRRSWYSSLSSLREGVERVEVADSVDQEVPVERVERGSLTRSKSMMDKMRGSLERLVETLPVRRRRTSVDHDSHNATLSASFISLVHQRSDHETVKHGLPSAGQRKQKCVSTDDSLLGGRACVVSQKDTAGRSRSLTCLDALDAAAMLARDARDAGDSQDVGLAPVDADGGATRLGVPDASPSGRRQKLARSQVSSSEYFSVGFELGEQDACADEFVPATKGVYLDESLASVCARHGVELDAVSVYLDPGGKTPLALASTEASWLGGRHVRVRARDDRGAKPGKPGQIPLRKTNSGSYRGKGGRFFSASTEDPGEGGDPKGSRASRQRWSGLFGSSKDSKKEALDDQLNYYSRHGVARPEADGLYELEEDWRDFVPDWPSLSDRRCQQQTAIWELVATEAAYIQTLKVVTDLFVWCLTRLQSAGLLNEIDQSRLFSNVTEVCAANRAFWQRHVLPMVQTARATRQPLDVSAMRDGFCKFAELFEPYTKYCVEQSQCQQYCREKHQENELFTTYLVWCETQKDCNRLRLMDIVVKPMQRLTRYSLLLKAVLKHTESEELRAALVLMGRHVDSFVYEVNTTLRQRQERDKLRGVTARIEAYDVVECKDDEVEKLVKQHGDLDLMGLMPGCLTSQRRQLLLEGDLRLKDHAASKMEVHCFLFTDLLLVCKPTNRKTGGVKVVRQPFDVSRLVGRELTRDTPTLALVYLTVYSTAAAAFTLSSSEAKLIKQWSDGIRKAQDLYAAARRASSPLPTATVSRQPSSSSCCYEDDAVELDAEEVAGGIGVPSRSTRGSSRVSSLAHSHSGSMEMEASSMSSVSHSRHVSVETELPSSDEAAPSPRRRSPNTLSIAVPAFSPLGQSLPNLSLATPPVALAPPTSLLLVPSPGKAAHHGLLSPGHRGVSYPPPSPPRGSLRRALALPQSRNPPLSKTRHVGSTLGSTAALKTDFDVPLITGVSPPSEEEADRSRQALAKRLSPRLESRTRYHTASVVDDLKPSYAEDSKKSEGRESASPKRLSWNCAVDDRTPLVRRVASSDSVQRSGVGVGAQDPFAVEATRDPRRDASFPTSDV